MRRRPFAWLRCHVNSLVDQPAAYDSGGRIVYANRIQRVVHTARGGQDDATSDESNASGGEPG